MDPTASMWRGSSRLRTGFGSVAHTADELSYAAAFTLTGVLALLAALVWLPAPETLPRRTDVAEHPTPEEALATEAVSPAASRASRINAGPNPKYFGMRRRVTWLNASKNDQVAGLGAVLVPGTVRDSLYVLDCLLNLDGGVRPEMVTTDTASYSDIVFGLFRLLGYQFCPRIADLTDQRLWRIDPHAHYGPLDPVTRHKVNTGRIATHWEDMLRVAGSLATGAVRAYDLLRMVGRDGQPTPLGLALADYGRIAKTLHLLAVLDPDDVHPAGPADRRATPAARSRRSRRRGRRISVAIPGPPV